MRWQKDARTKFDHLPPAFCRCSVSGKLSTSSSRFPQGICFPSPLKGKAKALSPARKQKISSLCSEIFGKNPSNAKRSPFLRKVPGFFRLERSESICCFRAGAQGSLPSFLRKKAGGSGDAAADEVEFRKGAAGHAVQEALVPPGEELLLPAGMEHFGKLQDFQQVPVLYGFVV